MIETLMPVPKKPVEQSKCDYFDEQIYSDLMSVILPAVNGDMSFLPSFEEIVDKINSYELRSDLKMRIVRDTISRLISDIDKTVEMPPFLMSYLCREALVNATINKFGSVLGVVCSDVTNLSHRIGDNVADAVNVFMSLRICDPAAHSGQFLCYMLNEMIVLMSQLGILVDKEGNPLYQYRFTSDEGHIVAFDKKNLKKINLEDGNKEALIILETLYYEKTRLIRNCLFGVENNTLSVLICKLRLWLETVSVYDGSVELNIPIVEANVICGDALVSRFELKDDLILGLQNINQSISDYKRLAENIKTEQNSENRHYLVELMQLIKKRLIEGIGWNSKDTTELLHLRRELVEIMAPTLFPLTEKEVQVRNERVLALHTQIKKQNEQINTFRKHPAFDSAVEWRYDFPEVLDDNAEYIGFDAIIGITPDAVVSAIGDRLSLFKKMNYRIFRRSGNIADMYCELANRLLVFGGCAAFVLPTQWRESPSSSRLNEYVVAEMNPMQLITFKNLETSYSVLKDKCAMIIGKDINHHKTLVCEPESSYNPLIAELGDYVRYYAVPSSSLVMPDVASPEISAVNIITTSIEYMNIKDKIRKLGLPVKNWDINIYSGVMTGCDEAFIIDRATRDRLMREDTKNADVIKPLLTNDVISQYGNVEPEKWILYVPWHFPLHYDSSIAIASERAEQSFHIQYPSVYEYLQKYKDRLSARNAIEIGIGFEWYAMQRAGINNNWFDFTELKIVWKRDVFDYSFAIDYGGCAVLDDTCFLVGQNLKFLLGVFNSTMGKYMMTDLSRMNIDDAQVGISLVEALSVPVPNGRLGSEIVALVNRRIAENNKSEAERRKTEVLIDNLVYELYELNDAEIAFVTANTKRGER